MSSCEPRVRIAFEPDPAPSGARFVADPLPGAPAPFRAQESPAASAGNGDAPPSPAAPEPLEDQLHRAYEAGRAAGRAELPWDGAESLERACTALGVAAGRLDALRRDYLLANRRVIVDLALAVAERLVREAVSADADGLARAVERALLPVAGHDGPVAVRLAPGDLATLEAGGDAIRERIAAAAGGPLCLEADCDLAPGDVSIVAGASRVDARIEEIVRRVRAELEDVLGTRAPGESSAGPEAATDPASPAAIPERAAEAAPEAAVAADLAASEGA